MRHQHGIFACSCVDPQQGHQQVTVCAALGRCWFPLRTAPSASCLGMSMCCWHRSSQHRVHHLQASLQATCAMKPTYGTLCRALPRHQSMSWHRGWCYCNSIRMVGELGLIPFQNDLTVFTCLAAVSKALCDPSGPSPAGHRCKVSCS